jgi:DNA gyrase subunit A
MDMERPDLSRVDLAVRAYIEALEAEVERLHSLERTRERGREGARPPRKAEQEQDSAEEEALLPPLEPAESPNTLHLVTITASGIAKRTPRHLYLRQRRGGWGALDAETSEQDPPAVIVVADEKDSLLVFTSLARAFRVPVQLIPETPLRGQGAYLFGRQAMQPEERVAAALPDRARGAVALVSQRGMVRTLRHHVFGEYMKPGTLLFDSRHFGPLCAACRTPGDGDLLIASRQGRAIRFSEKLVSPQGGPGLRLEEGDEAVGITAVYQESGVFLIGADGRGTIRLMSGFNPNKSAGGSGKIVMNTDGLAGVATASEEDDIFLISQGSKMIRFMAAEVPGKEAVVQGVNCMALRADKVTALAVTPSSVI